MRAGTTFAVGRSDYALMTVMLISSIGLFASCFVPVVGAVAIAVSVVLGVLLIVFGGLFVALALPLVVYLALKLISYLVSSGAPPLTFGFLSGEGRQFVALSLLIIVLSLRVDRGTFERYAQFLFLPSVLWALAFLFSPRSLFVNSGVSHHQIGSAAFLSLLVVFFWGKKKPVLLVVLVSALPLAALFYSGSRTMLLCGVILCFSFLHIKVFAQLISRKRAALAYLASAMIVLGGMESWNFSVGGRTYDLSVLRLASDAFNYGYQYPESIIEARDSYSDFGFASDFNLVARFVLFGKAVRYWAGSPIIGGGVGSFDDEGKCLLSRPICFRVALEASHVGITAHNVYLHLAAEEGIVGLFFFGYLIWVCLRVASFTDVDYFNGQMKLAVVMSALFAGIFQHSFASPLYAIAMFVPMLILARSPSCRNGER